MYLTPPLDKSSGTQTSIPEASEDSQCSQTKEIRWVANMTIVYRSVQDISLFQTICPSSMLGFKKDTLQFFPQGIKGRLSLMAKDERQLG